MKGKDTILVNAKFEVPNVEILQLIFDYNGRISVERSIENVMLILGDLSKNLTKADHGFLWLVDHKNSEIYSKRFYDKPQVHLPLKTGLVSHAILNNKELIIENPKSDARYDELSDSYGKDNMIKEMIIIPIKNMYSDIIGAFQLISENKKADSSAHNNLRLLADYAGKAVESAKFNIEVEQGQKEIAFLLGRVGEYRSMEGGNHVTRVAAFSNIMAKNLGLSDREIELISLGSPMHDIGKIGIPDAILQKPGKLSAEEYLLIKSHATIGYELLKSSNRELLQAAAIIAHEHHERYDGKGYPRALKGDEIHVYGKIAALSDVFDALICKRVYKAAWEPTQVFDLIKKERGNQFDPDVVDAFFKGQDKIMEIKTLYEDAYSQ